MKWITEISLTNYRAFGITEKVKIPKGNHLLIYGENGSGKSSIYNGLKDFFSSSLANGKTKYKLNKFLETSGNAVGNVTVSISEIGNENAPVELKFNAPPTASTNNQNEIILANKFKGFLDYKRMLKVHSLEVAEDKQPELFDLILKELLAEHRIPDPKGGATTVEFLKEYTSIASILSSIKSPFANTPKTELQDILFATNEALQSVVEEIGNSKEKNDELSRKHEKLLEDKKSIDDATIIHDTREQLIKLDASVKTLLTRVISIANDFLKDHFKNKLVLDINYSTLEFIERDGKMKESLSLKIKYAGREIEFYQTFLNEARLSALAICIYLASIKTFIPESDTLKVLYLDDVFIGLDTTNRFPLLEIIKAKFIDDGFQVFISTYDREWFELSRHWFQIKVGSGKIKSLELFIEDDGNPNTPDYPVVIPYDGNLAKAKALFKCKDYPAAGNYLRKECEAIIKTYLPSTFKIDDKGILIDELEPLMQQLEKFFEVSQIAKPQELIDAIKIYRRALLNPTSHSDIKSPLFKKEIDEAFVIVAKLKALPEIKWTKIYGKGDTFTYENLGSHYSMQIELADHLYLSVHGGAKTFSKHRFRIKTWTRNTVEFATDAIGTVMPLPAREHACEQPRTLAEIFHGINQSTGIAIPLNLLAEIKIGATGTLHDLLQ